MSQKFVVGYDGSAVSKRAVEFAIDRANAQGGEVVIAHVLEWSPFSFLTPTELEERHKRRQQELERAEASLIGPIVEELSGRGVTVTSIVNYGHIADTLCKIAGDVAATQLVVGRTGHNTASVRIFGSVAGSLAQSSPVPCTIVP
ncbi:universal stress protein [Thalassovita sp.]|jgi:nucleotide-binding universal stress UspA family protein|uniref:universal stress protein n=1 Tax=Thalassovita sp. TaxID=1979401 RepID=UPI003B5B9846